jgi:hypothetical protein
MNDDNKKYYPDEPKPVEKFKEIIKKEDTDRQAEMIACTETKVDRTGAVIPCKKGK